MCTIIYLYYIIYKGISYMDMVQWTRFVWWTPAVIGIKRFDAYRIENNNYRLCIHGCISCVCVCANYKTWHEMIRCNL